MAGNLKELTDENFKNEVADGVTLVDFYAEWCGPCRMMAPMIEELAAEFGEKAKFAKLNIEQAPDITSATGVTSIPTIIVFKNGEEVERVIGVKDKESLTKMVSAQL